MQAINKEKLYSTEDGEPTQAEDPEEAHGESQLRHALQFDEYAIARVLSLCEFSPQVGDAVIPNQCWNSVWLLSYQLLALFLKRMFQDMSY